MATNKAAQRQIIASVSGINGYFSQITGGAVTAATSKVFDGGAKFPDVVSGSRDVADVTVTRPYTPDVDEPILAKLRPVVGAARADVVVQACDADLVPVGRPRTYAQALLTGITEPDGDASSGTPATYSLVWTVGTVS